MPCVNQPSKLGVRDGRCRLRGGDRGGPECLAVVQESIPLVDCVYLMRVLLEYVALYCQFEILYHVCVCMRERECKSYRACRIIILLKMYET